MGNKNCVLGVQTEKRVYFSGELVHGRIFLSVNDPNGVVAQAVKLHYSGIERGVVHYTEERSDTNDRTRQIERYEENEVSFLNFDIPVNTPVGNVFPQGQYEFPFEFILPQDIPSSMYCKKWQSTCEVRYEMTAYLDTSNGRSSVGNLFNGNIKSKPLQLNIFGSSNNNIAYSPYLMNTTTTTNTTATSHNHQPIYFPGETHKVRNCCCCYRGQMNLRASLDDGGLFIPTQSRSLSFDLTNNSRAEVENVTVELIERVSWKPQFREEAMEVTLFKSVIDASANRDWMSSTQRMVHSTTQDYMSLSPTSAQGGALHHGLGHVVNVSTPHNARDSYSGRMIFVEHYVRVKVVTRGCCVSNPETTADVIVMRPMSAFDNGNNGSDGINIDDYSSSVVAPPVPSAPPLGNEDVGGGAGGGESTPIVEAIVLPPDWSPLTSDVVTLPIANAVTVSNDQSNGGGGSNNKGGQYNT